MKEPSLLPATHPCDIPWCVAYAVAGCRCCVVHETKPGFRADDDGTATVGKADPLCDDCDGAGTFFDAGREVRCRCVDGCATALSSLNRDALNYLRQAYAAPWEPPLPFPRPWEGVFERLPYGGRYGDE